MKGKMISHFNRKINRLSSKFAEAICRKLSELKKNQFKCDGGEDAFNFKMYYLWISIVQYRQMH